MFLCNLIRWRLDYKNTFQIDFYNVANSCNFTKTTKYWNHSKRACKTFFNRAQQEKWIEMWKKPDLSQNPYLHAN